MSPKSSTTDVSALLSIAVSALGGAERSGQIEMAEAVGHAFDNGEHLAVQAGTGTGKSLAYLVPSIAHAVASNQPVVVSTATIALQRQLVDRDLPRLADALAPHLPRRPEFALLKGRGNYLCLNKVHSGATAEEDLPQEELFNPVAASALGRDVKRLIEWSSDTESGDRDEVVPGVLDRAWSQVSVGARECIGATRCPYGTDCFAREGPCQGGCGRRHRYQPRAAGHRCHLRGQRPARAPTTGGRRGPRTGRPRDERGHRRTVRDIHGRGAATRRPVGGT
ncbi:ATP-dependent DNA helicase DinG [Mycolicibacterium aubagnense]